MLPLRERFYDETTAIKGGKHVLENSISGVAVSTLSETGAHGELQEL
jgi:hypothetical protein